jgi:hypothetical protein
MRMTALKNATHVEVTKFTPEKERTYYIWVTKDQRGKEVLATKQVAIAANPHKVDGLAFKEFNPKGLQSTTIKPTVRSLRRTPTLPTSRSVAVSYQPMEPPTCPMRSSSRVLPQVSIPFRFQTLRLTMVTTTWPVSASMPTSRVSLSTMAERC